MENEVRSARVRLVFTNFVLNSFGPQIDELAVFRVSQKEIVQQLRSMPFCKLFNRLEFEDRAAKQKIEIISLAKRLEDHFNRNFAACFRQSLQKFVLVDFLIEKPAQVLVDFEQSPHDLIGYLCKLVLSQSWNFVWQANRHDQ